MRIIKSPYFVIGSLVMLIVCLLWHHSYDPTARIIKSRLLKTQSDSESKSLLHILRRASKQDRSVILTIVNQAWATPGSIIDLFLESFRIGQGTKPLLNHLVIINLDIQAFQYCNSIHPHCFLLTNSRRKFTTKKHLVNPNHPSLAWRRNALVGEVLQLGYNVIFTEADVMWLRNPLYYLDPLYDITISCDFYSRDQQSINIKTDGVLFYMKSSAVSSELFKILKLDRVLHPNSQDESICETINRDDIARAFGLRIQYLDEANFGGFCQPDVDPSKICTIHANCCEDVNSKVHDLKLVLEDWRNFTAAENAGFAGSSLPWRAPNKCRG